MHDCYKMHGQRRRRLSLCCYGAQGCTLARSATGISASKETSQDRCTGADPKQASGSLQASPRLKCEFSDAASLQDLYLLLNALSEGGWHVSVSAQASPGCVPLPLDTAELSTCSMQAFQSIVSQVCWDALIMCLSGTTRR